MKRYSFNLNQVVYKKIFPEYRIKTKAHIIEVLMEATRFILLQNDSDFRVNDSVAAGKMILHIDKMNRLFFFSSDKYYSIVFPFHLREEGERIRIIFKSNIEVNHRLISKVISIIQCDEFKEQCSLDFVTPICDAEDDCDENFWVFLRELLLMEDGYIRYDYDQDEHGEAQERGEGNRHPLYHYDLFYSSDATFKIGLKEELTHDSFLDLLNIRTGCKFIEG